MSANGLLDVLGRCEVCLQLGGVDVIHPVLVAGDITQDRLVGIGFLSKYMCEISFAKDTLKVSREITALSKVNVDSVVCRRISMAETVTVPGCHEMVMMAKVNGLGGSGVTGVVEPSPGFTEPHNTMLARVIAEPKGDLVPVRVRNSSLHLVVLYQKEGRPKSRVPRRAHLGTRNRRG